MRRIRKLSQLIKNNRYKYIFRSNRSGRNWQHAVRFIGFWDFEPKEAEFVTNDASVYTATQLQLNTGRVKLWVL